ncbi:hypothetical protein GCM10022226_71030 [Sphaerisporangium flaviroseum]|uniref:Uncharacterized protein n=1 Tax=Sphaerisporangium flaviroseum TaxID=509199 RepID=A0ABP7J9F7_9ACTN
MMGRCAGISLFRASANARWLTLFALVVVVSTAFLSPQEGASAAASGRAFGATPVGDDRGAIYIRNGNGSKNNSYSAVHSPTNNRGVQQVANSIAGGGTYTQQALCKKRHRVCSIYQKLRVSHK